jgi:proline iminopeptidase
VKRAAEARERYWAAHASPGRRAALRRNRDARGTDKLASLSPAKALVARYVADGPMCWYDPDFDASPLWQGMSINMDVLDALYRLFTEYELAWDPARLPAPVLVLMGRHDYVVPHVLWDEVLPKLPKVTYHLFEKSGHTPQLDEPRLFDQVLIEWLQT